MKRDGKVPTVKNEWLWPVFEDILDDINEHLDLRLERSNMILIAESTACYYR